MALSAIGVAIRRGLQLLNDAKAPNHELPTLNFQIIPGADWQPFTLEFLKHQECRGKAQYEKYLGAELAKGLTCPLAK